MQPCVRTPSQRGDGRDNDCDGEIDEDECVGFKPDRDCSQFAKSKVSFTICDLSSFKVNEIQTLKVKVEGKRIIF